jgi:transcriptional regulator with XRE-family HTH domain
MLAPVDTLAARLRWILEQRGVSQRALAIKAGLAPSHVSLILNHLGDRVAMETIRKLAEAASVSVDWLASGEGAADAGADATEPHNENLPGWRENEPEARKRSGLPAWTFERARKMRGLVPPQGASVEFIVDAAMMVLRHMPLDEKVAAVTKQLERELGAQQKAAETRAKKKGAKK